MAESQRILPPEMLDRDYGVTDADRRAGRSAEDRSAALAALFEEWLAEDPAYDREVAPKLREALDAHRVPESKLFAEHESHTA